MLRWVPLRKFSARAVAAVERLQASSGLADACESAFQDIVALDTSDEMSTFFLQHGRGPIVDAMRAHAGNATIAKAAARTLGNMTLVELPTAATTTDDQTGAGAAAALLAKAGAAELLIHAFTSHFETFDWAGRCWLATALMNLVLRSDEGAQRAAKHHAEAVCAAALASSLNAIGRASASHFSEEGSITVARQGATVEALTAVIARILSLEAPDNANGFQFRYQLVAVPVVEALVQVVGAGAGSSLRQVVGLEAEHKAWEALRLIASDSKAHPLVFRALGSYRQASSATATSSGSEHTQQHKPVVVDVLQRWCGHCADAVTTSSSSSSSSSSDMALTSHLQRRILLCGLGLFTDISGQRQDQLVLPAAEQTSAADDRAGAATHYPTEAAEAVVGALSGGAPLGTFVVEALVHLAGAATMGTGAAAATGDDDVPLAVAQLAANLAAQEDPIIVSANGLVAVERCLMAAATTTGGGDGGGVAYFSAAAAAKLLAVLWNVLSTGAGVAAFQSLDLMTRSDDLFDRLAASYASQPEAAGIQRLADQLREKVEALLVNPRFADDPRQTPKRVE